MLRLLPPYAPRNETSIFVASYGSCSAISWSGISATSSSSSTEASAATTITVPVSTQATAGKANVNLEGPYSEGYSYTVHQEFLSYLETNAATTKTSFTTGKVREYENWLIFPNEKPNAPKSKMIFPINQYNILIFIRARMPAAVQLAYSSPQ